MRGYKVLDENMCAVKGNKMQYKLNKEYILDDIICLRYRGYHFCKKIINAIYYYYNIDNIRVFEIDTLDGSIHFDDDLYCSNKIKLVRELSKEELKKYFENNLDKFINDPDPYVRFAVASQRYGLDKLINDPDPSVRRVAKHKYGLDILINDTDPYVRKIVANQGYGLDRLINDPDPSVRATVTMRIYF